MGPWSLVLNEIFSCRSSVIADISCHQCTFHYNYTLFFHSTFQSLKWSVWMTTPAKSHGKPCHPWKGTQSSTPCSAWWETLTLNRYSGYSVKVCYCFVFCVLHSSPAADLPFITGAFLCRSGYRWIQGLNVLPQSSVLVTTGFKLPIMQRSLIHEVSQVYSPC